MARNNEVSDQTYQQAMQVFAENGYDISRFGKVPQLPAHIGQLGYQSITK